MNKIRNEAEAFDQAMDSKHKLFFVNDRSILIGTIKRIINLSANVLRETF